MPELPAVSVVTTAYNAEAFIEPAIRSVLDQRGVQVEHVIVDDGSDDRTVEMVRAVGDPRIHVVEAGRVGRGCALNLALDATRHEYVAVLDADDVSHPDRLAVELRAIIDRPDLAAVGTGQLLLRGATEPVWPMSDDTDFDPAVRDVGGEVVYYNPLSHSSVLFRRAALERVGGYDARRRALFDWDLYLRLVAAGFQLAKLEIPLVGKRIHPQQFFEGGKTVTYAFECLLLQWRALAPLGRSRLNAPLLVGLLAYRLVPRSFRLAVRDLFGRRPVQTRRTR